jgi:hypothetical protein
MQTPQLRQLTFSLVEKSGFEPISATSLSVTFMYFEIENLLRPLNDFPK